MKLRFEKNSIRFRVRKSDLELLNHQGFVQETVQFPGTVFMFQLRVSGEGEPAAEFSGNSIAANIPVGMATEWINTEEVGIYHVQHINDQPGRYPDRPRFRPVCPSETHRWPPN